jgi:predicted Zn-dependent protease
MTHRRERSVTAQLRLRALAAVAASMLAAGCAMLEKQGETPVAAPVPPAAPRTVGIETLSNAEHRRLVAQFGGEYRFPAAERYLNDMLNALAAASEGGTPYRVTILNTPVVNAFALPSGNIYVSRGLLTLADDASEVAAVMAHEIGHVTARHAAARAEREKQAAVITQAANVIQSRQKGEEVEASQKLSFASFSRQQEIDADKIGIATISAAGYDPYGASRFLASLGRSTSLRAELLGRSSSSKPDLLATHPSTPERIAQAIQAARQIGAPGVGKRDAAGYLAAIDGMMFGDDPADGVVRGRRFTHARLGISFIAPDGFVLENSQKALLGNRDAGTEALRLDSVPAPETTTLESYLASGWIDGIITSSIESGSVNGLPAAFAIARAGEWNFRVAVIRVGGDIFRLIFAARSLDDASDKRFRAAIETFRQLDSASSAAVKPQRIAVVTAGPADSAVTMASRMMVADRPLETFQLLNGLGSDEPVQAGQLYKIVVE